MNNKIVIAVSTDENYIVPSCVMLYSLLQNSAKTGQYEIHLFVPGSFSAEDEMYMISHLADFKNCSTIFHNMADAFREGALFENNHITTAAYYRLSLASLLSGEDKCLYLDADIIVNNDISELYNTALDGYYIAGIRAAAYQYKKEERHLPRLGIDSVDNYINSGVTLLNLKAIREDCKEDDFIALLKREFLYHDQDILNVACFGKIKILPLKFNLMTKYNVLDDESYTKMPFLPVCYPKNEWDEAISNPVIIHWASKEKPWDHLELDFSELWWSYFLKCFNDKKLIMKRIELAIYATRQTIHENRS